MKLSHSQLRMLREVGYFYKWVNGEMIRIKKENIEMLNEKG